MTTTAETRTFAAACLLDPWDETPRRIFSDWLEEHGEADRANLIRFQIALARRLEDAAGRFLTLPESPLGQVIERCRAAIKDILSRHTGDKATGERWDRLKCEKCEGTGEVGVQRSRSLRDVDVQCDVCGGSGDLAVRQCQTCEGRGQFCSGECRGSGYVPRQPHWDRGFLHLGCEIAEAVEERECPDCREVIVLAGTAPPGCSRCSGTGRIPTLTAWGRAVLDSGCGLWLEGVEPICPTAIARIPRDTDRWVWFWRYDEDMPEGIGLPPWLHRVCPDLGGDWPSPDAAKLAIARAFTAWSARQVLANTSS